MRRQHAAFPALALCAALGCNKDAPAAAPAPAPPPPAAEPAAAPPEQEPFGRLTLDEVEARIKEAAAGRGKIAVFDNNGADRYARSHVPGARWVKFDEVKLTDLPADKDTPLVFYCSNEF